MLDASTVCVWCEFLHRTGGFHEELTTHYIFSPQQAHFPPTHPQISKSLTHLYVRRGGWGCQHFIMFWQHHLVVWAEWVLAAVGGGSVGSGVHGRWEREPLQAGGGARWSWHWADVVGGWHREHNRYCGVWIPVDEHDLDGSRLAAQVHLVLLLTTLALKHSNMHTSAYSHTFLCSINSTN